MKPWTVRVFENTQRKSGYSVKYIKTRYYFDELKAEQELAKVLKTKGYKPIEFLHTIGFVDVVKIK